MNLQLIHYSKKSINNFLRSISFTSILTMDAETTYKFIEKIHSTECLWSISSKAYKNKILRDDLWNSLATEFNMTGPDAYGLFRKLREKYRRESEKQKGRSGAAATKPSNWPYMKSLEFLDEAYKKRKVSTSQNWGDADESVISLDEEEPSTSQVPPKSNEFRQSRSHSKTPARGSSIADALKETTDKIVKAFKDSGHDEVITFIRGTFNCLEEEDKINFEEELMNVAMNFRFKNKKYLKNLSSI